MGSEMCIRDTHGAYLVHDSPPRLFWEDGGTCVRSVPLRHVRRNTNETRYLMFPLGFMLYFGDPNWYEKYVLPVRAAT